MNPGLIIGICGLIAFLLFQEYFFGRDDGKGFPRSRKRK